MGIILFKLKMQQQLKDLYFNCKLMDMDIIRLEGVINDITSDQTRKINRLEEIINNLTVDQTQKIDRLENSITELKKIIQDINIDKNSIKSEKKSKNKKEDIDNAIPKSGEKNN